MQHVRRATERGHADHGWLNSFHTFSFGDYVDPRFMGFSQSFPPSAPSGNVRVINEDRVKAGQGFGTHPHRDMEIISYVVQGALAHKDSLGTGSTIVRGDVQRMTAGSGVTHSEFNASAADAVHFLQIWLLPRARSLLPTYEQKFFSDDDKRGQLRVVASPDGRDGSITLHAEATMFAGLLSRASIALPTRRGFVHVVTGTLQVNGAMLHAGDVEPAEVLAWSLA
jgi:quercetin 2,3-dioxygenase